MSAPDPDDLRRLQAAGVAILVPQRLSVPLNLKVLYLLHCSDPEERFRHYLGIADVGQLIVRLRRHVYGTGAVVTTHWSQSVAAVSLAAVVVDASFAQERKLKVRSHYDAWCPICSHTTTGCSLADAAKIAPDLRVRWRPSDFG